MGVGDPDSGDESPSEPKRSDLVEPYSRLTDSEEGRGRNDSSREVCVDRLEAIQDRAQETINQQVRWIRAIDRKSMRILRFNFVILGLLLSIFSLLFNSGVAGNVPVDAPSDGSQFVNIHTKYGGLALLLSTVFAGLTYTASTMQLGVGSPLVREVPDSNYGCSDFHEDLAEYYADWIEQNQSKLSVNALLITSTTWLTVYGVVLLSLGIARPLFDFVPPNSFVWVTVVVALLAVVSMTDKL